MIGKEVLYFERLSYIIRRRRLLEFPKLSTFSLSLCPDQTLSFLLLKGDNSQPILNGGGFETESAQVLYIRCCNPGLSPKSALSSGDVAHR